MTIHDVHPFATPTAMRRPLRRFRGRLPAPVSIWSSALNDRPVGLTVSSLVVADGEPGEVIGLIDATSDLFEALVLHRVWAISLLAYADRQVGDVMAGLAPSPGGPFATERWRETEYGLVLQTSPGWMGVRMLEEPVEAGWSMLVRGAVEHVEIDDDVAPVGYVRGRYREL